VAIAEAASAARWPRSPRFNKSYVSQILRLALLVPAAAFRRRTYGSRDRFALDIELSRLGLD
jgi:hypothetical protein